MIDVEVLEFCEDNAISIEKFLKDNFEFAWEEPRKKGQKRHRLKHNEITSWPNIILVPLPFAHRCKELVLKGKLVIVMDEFGKYAVYINPRIIVETLKLAELENTLENYSLIPDEYLKDEEIENEKRQTIAKIADIEENLRLIKHFNGEESLSYTQSVTGAIRGEKVAKRTRKKRVEK